MTARSHASLAAAALVLALQGLAGPCWASPMRTADRYQYLSPLPGSRWVSPGNNIAIRPGEPLDAGTIDDASVIVVGSRSGSHTGTCRLSDDAKTLVFTPLLPFALGETVRATLRPGARVARGGELPPLEFEFSITSRDPLSPPPSALTRSDLGLPSTAVETAGGALASPVRAAVSNLPLGFPAITLLASNQPEPGCVFITPRDVVDIAPLVIVDSLGMPIFFRRGPSDLFDLKKLPNGLLTYFDLGRAKAFALNDQYAVVDSFEAGNGYIADFHDLEVLPDGHVLLLIYDTQPVSMDTVVVGGDPNALVMGVIIQELDASKNVVFQWRSWDHFLITDAVNVDLTAPFIDYVHCNAVERDTDGNLMISSRHLNEITKINRQTGAVMWRLGRNAVHNDFRFIGDPRGFAYQHDIRRAPNGNITLFDNGNFLNPQYSRALEYKLDEQNKTVTLIHQYVPSLGGWGHSSGSAQLRTTGGTTVCWGSGSVVPDVTEFHPNGTKAFEITFSPPSMTTYRAYRFNWRGALFTADQDLLDFGTVDQGNSDAVRLGITNHGAADLAITSFVCTDTAAFTVADAVPLIIAPGATAFVRVEFHPNMPGTARGILYVRSASQDELIAQVVELQGFSKGLVDVPQRPGSRSLSLAQNLPNPARGELAIPFSLARPGAVTLRVYDLTGCVAATLFDGPLPAGGHLVHWDGTRDGGARVPPGAYFYELRSSGERLQRRLLQLR